jgi:hypothetical protein
MIKVISSNKEHVQRKEDIMRHARFLAGYVRVRKRPVG